MIRVEHMKQNFSLDHQDKILKLFNKLLQYFLKRVSEETLKSIQFWSFFSKFGQKAYKHLYMNEWNNLPVKESWLSSQPLPTAPQCKQS